MNTTMKKGNDIPKLYDENGNLLVLVSPGYGAGFSTWICEEVCYDARIVGAFIDNKSAYYVSELIKSLGYDTCPYMGGYLDCVVCKVPKGSLFRINEYDGSESIEIFSETNYILA